MKKLIILALALGLIAATVLLVTCRHGESELFIRTDFEKQTYSMHDVLKNDKDPIGRLWNYNEIEYGGNSLFGVASHDPSLRINGKDVIAVTVVNMGGGKTGIYCAFTEEQKPKIEHDASTSKTTLKLNGGTVLAAAWNGNSVINTHATWKYKKENKSLNGTEITVLNILMDK